MIRPRNAIALCSLVLIAPVATAVAGPGTSTSVLIATEDTYSRQLAPNDTHGSAGALHVSGSMATNENNQMLGVADSWLRYDTSNAIAQFDSDFGPGNWVIQTVQLSLREQAFPNSPNLTRGAGDFEVSWIANDNWTEGFGTANSPETANGNELSWAYGQTLLDGNADQSLGIFSSIFETGRRNFTLGLDASFVGDVESGGNDVTLRLTPADDTIGYTLNSEDNIFNDNNPDPFLTRKPLMIIEAVVIPEPATALLLGLLGMGVCRRRRN